LHLTKLPKKTQIEVSNGFAFEFCILVKLANEGENLVFLPDPDDLAKTDRSLLPHGFRSPARLRLLFPTQSLTARRRPPCEETPPHAPPSLEQQPRLQYSVSHFFFLEVNAMHKRELKEMAAQHNVRENAQDFPARRNGWREEKKHVKK